MGRAALWYLAGALVVSLVATPPARAEDGSDRFQVRGEIHTLARSNDGRFALGADLKVVPEQGSMDGRFVMKAVHVPEASCDPLLELFANGFEGS